MIGGKYQSPTQNTNADDKAVITVRTVRCLDTQFSTG